MDYYLKFTEEMGRGLYAHYDLKPNIILFTAELLVLSPEDTKIVNQTDLKYYVFKYNDTQDCLALGDAEIFNHSDNPNIGYQLKDWDGRKRLFFYTLREIKRDEQLFIDYNADVLVDTTQHKVNLVGS